MAPAPRRGIFAVDTDCMVTGLHIESVVAKRRHTVFKLAIDPTVDPS